MQFRRRFDPTPPASKHMFRLRAEFGEARTKNKGPGAASLGVWTRLRSVAP